MEIPYQELEIATSWLLAHWPPSLCAFSLLLALSICEQLDMAGLQAQANVYPEKPGLPKARKGSLATWAGSKPSIAATALAPVVILGLGAFWLPGDNQGLASILPWWTAATSESTSPLVPWDNLAPFRCLLGLLTVQSLALIVAIIHSPKYHSTKLVLGGILLWFSICSATRIALALYGLPLEPWL